MLIFAALLLMMPHTPAAASMVAGELVNGKRAVVITGEIQIPQVTQAIREAVNKHADAELLAEVMYHENWNTDPDHLAAYYTGAVVMNRVNSDVWPDTIRDVLYQSGQYSTTRKFFTKELPGECLEMAKRIIEEGTSDVPETVVFQSMRKQGSGVWREINGEFFCYE